MSVLENQIEDYFNPNQNITEEKKVNYAERFDIEKKEWTDIIKDISSRFRKVEDLVEVQVDLYSRRQEITEYLHQLQVLQSKIKKAYLSAWKKAYENLTLNEDIRYNEREKSKMADEMSSSTKIKMEILQVHIDFFRESVKTIDNMIFGVKHRLEIEDFRRGNK